MTLEKATLPVPQFDQITLDQLKTDIQTAIDNGQAFISDLQAVPDNIQAQLQILERIDTLENQMLPMPISTTTQNSCRAIACHISAPAISPQ